MNHQEILSEGYRVRLIVRQGDDVIKIEPNLVFRGSVFPAEERKLVSTARERLEADVAVTTLSEADVYGGKLCAALDRQHPRDLFDVRELWNAGGLTEEIRQAFVVYLAGHPRPMSKILAPRLKRIESEYETQFQGMTVNPVRLEDLVEVQHALGSQLRSALTDDERAFLVSLQRGEPEWDRMPFGHLRDLPALQWKLLNVARMTPLKRRQAVAKLQSVQKIEETMLPFTPRLRSVFAYAEAQHPDGVSSLDIFIGILSLDGGVAFNLHMTKGFVPVASAADLRSDESPIAWNACALTALAGAVETAVRMSHQLVGVEHMLAGILMSPSPELVATLTQKGTHSAKLLTDLRKELYPQNNHRH